MRLVLLVLLIALTGCQRVRDAVRLEPPAAKIIEVPVEVYVPIDKALTKRCPWVKACKPSAGMACAKERADCLRQYEGQFGAIEQMQGKPVPEKVGDK